MPRCYKELQAKMAPSSKIKVTADLPTVLAPNTHTHAPHVLHTCYRHAKTGLPFVYIANRRSLSSVWSAHSVIWEP